MSLTFNIHWYFMIIHIYVNDYVKILSSVKFISFCSPVYGIDDVREDIFKRKMGILWSIWAATQNKYWSVEKSIHVEAQKKGYNSFLLYLIFVGTKRRQFN